MADVSLRGLSKSFGETKVIKHVDLEVKEGEFVVFVGPSGCGKSTLLRLIAGLEDISSGDLFIDNIKVNNLPSLERGVGMVFQSYALYPHMSVAENMAFGLKLAKAPKQLINEKVNHAAELLKLDKLLDRKPKALSGGQRQRVAIGRCIVRAPKVFLFDEPLSNLDASLRVEMRIAIAKLHNDLKNTMIYVTHDQVEAMTLADKIVVLNAGEISQVGSPLELYHYPENLFVAGFIGSPKMNFIDGKIADIGTDSITVSLPNNIACTVLVDTNGASIGDKVTLGIRPEDTVPPSEGDIVLSAPIIVEEHLGHESLIYLDVENSHENFIVRLHTPPKHKAGENLEVGIPFDQCHLFSEDGTAFRRKFDATDIINNAKH